MSAPRDYLGHITGGKVLDVATGAGNFIGFLKEGLKDYSEIIGIDSNERAQAAFTGKFKDMPDIHFKSMDAGRMSFPDSSFDTVCIAYSLHHMADLDSVILEMKRITRPGGNIIVLEMFRDGQAETQLTHVLLHHWWAAIDQSMGVLHNETFTRTQVLDLVGKFSMRDAVVYEISDLESDPRDADGIKQLESGIDQSIQRIKDNPELVQRGEELRRRVVEIGFHNAASLLVVGRK